MKNNYLDFFKQQQDIMLAVLKDIVELESPSDDIDGNNKLVSYVANLCKASNLGVELVEQSDTGNHLKVVCNPNKAKRQILLLCHLDTVWPAGTLKRRPFKCEAGRIYGPGIFDMKTGAVQAIFALKAIKKLGLKLDKRVVAIFSTDEEIGSKTSRTVIEGEARQSDVVLVLEPAMPPKGALKTFRKGVGSFTIRITGRASHAGNAPKEGVSAITELAHQVIHLQSLANEERGTTVSVGVIKGGTKSNVIPAEAEAKIDIRVTSLEEAERTSKDMLTVKSFVPGTKVEISGGIGRPPMIRTEKTVELFQLAKKLGEEYGLQLEEAMSGGGSDGNFTAAMGIPTLDGLGAVGDGAHANHEYVELSEIAPRTALLLKLIQTL